MKTLSVLCIVLAYVLDAYATQPVFNSIFPHQYFLGTYVGIPKQSSYGVFQKNTSSSSISLHGWVNPSANLSLAQESNYPMGFSLIPNHVLLNQGALVVEKSIDSSTPNDDYGFNFTSLYGMDYRFSIMKGVFSQQYINENLPYGYDPVVANLQFFLPELGQGSIVTIGRYLAPGDIETPLTPQNYLVSHSISFVFSAFTQMGLTISTKINELWSIFWGIHFGSDNAIWSNSGMPSAVFFLQWVAPNKKDALWFGTNAINSGQYRNYWNNIQQINFIWTHRFNPSFFIETSSYYEYQFNALNGGFCSSGPYRSFDGTIICDKQIPGLSNSFSLLTYIEKQWTDADFTSLRLEFFDDFQGQRTGYVAPYFEFTLGLTHVLGHVLKIRPEVRYDFALKNQPYDNGNKKSLVLGLLDFVLLL
jgi:hypothetical protein